MGRKDARNVEIYRRWCRGERQADLAREYGLSQPRVSEIITAQRGHLSVIDRAAVREAMVEQLNEVRSKMHELMNKEGAPLVKTHANESGVSVVYVREPAENGEPGEYVRDYSLQIKAAQEIVRAQSRLSALLGADEPARVDTTATVRYQIVGVTEGDVT